MDAFKIFDINNTGKISVKNLKKILVKIGQDFTEEEADDIIKYIKVDKEGNIDIEDFIQNWKFQ
jgi:Ca2+-binding EF-hand superfamily protein